MKQALVVLGMHRSGTSSIAGAFSLLGARAPATLLEPAPDNPRGFWESRLIIGRNDDLLTLGGSYWRDWRRFDIATVPPDELVRWRGDVSRTLVEEFGDASAIVLKDPRMCRLGDGWDGVLSTAGYRAGYVLPVRPPLEVARSLMRRNGLTVAEGLLLWLRHVLDAEIATRGQPRRIMVWSDFMQDWRAEVARLSSVIGWTPKHSARTDAKVDAFLDVGLRNERLGDPDAAPDPEAHIWAEAVFAIHATMARDGEDAAAHAQLDDLRATFDRATQIFSRQVGALLWEAERASLDRDAWAERHRQADERATILLGERDAALVARDAAEDGARRAAQRLAEAERRIADLTVTLGQLHRQVRDGERTAIDQTRRIDDDTRQIADLTDRCADLERALEAVGLARDQARADHRVAADLLDGERTAHGHERDAHRLSRDRVELQNRTIEELAARGEAMDRIIDDLTAMIDTLNGTVVDLNGRIAGLEAALAGEQSVRSDESEAHRTQVRTLRDEIARLSKRLDQEFLAHHDLRLALRRRPVRTAWSEWSPAARDAVLGRQDDP